MSLRPLALAVLAPVIALIPFRQARAGDRSSQARRAPQTGVRRRGSSWWAVVGFAALTLCPIVYAAWLTSAWLTVLACTPAVLVLTGLVAGLVGAIFEAREMI